MTPAIERQIAAATNGGKPIGVARAKAIRAMVQNGDIKIKPPPESAIQQQLMRWWKLQHKALGVPDERLLMAFPLQGARTKKNGGRMKSEGCRKGTPDMLLAVAGYDPNTLVYAHRPCLWIELKNEAGRASPEQKEMLTLLESQGHCTALVHGFDEACETITKYLRG